MSARNVVRVDADLRDLIPTFLANRQKDLGALTKALERRDFESIRNIGHNLRGVGGGYGFDAITELGKRLEIAARSQDLVACRRGVEEYGQYLDGLEVVFV
jgi:histidine phosphotransfer protein HptB